MGSVTVLFCTVLNTLNGKNMQMLYWLQEGGFTWKLMASYNPFLFFFVLLPSPPFQFEKDYLEFKNQIEDLHQSMQELVDSWFEKSLTVSNSASKKPDLQKCWASTNPTEISACCRCSASLEIRPQMLVRCEIISEELSSIGKLFKLKCTQSEILEI